MNGLHLVIQHGEAFIAAGFFRFRGTSYEGLYLAHQWISAYQKGVSIENALDALNEPGDRYYKRISSQAQWIRTFRGIGTQNVVIDLARQTVSLCDAMEWYDEEEYLETEMAQQQDWNSIQILSEMAAFHWDEIPFHLVPNALQWIRQTQEMELIKTSQDFAIRWISA